MAGSALGFTLGNATNAVLNTYSQDRRIYVGSYSSRTDRTTTWQDVSIEWALGRPSTLRGKVRGSSWTPAVGAEIRIHDDGSNGAVLIFAGHITRVDLSIARQSDAPIYDIEATDYTWELGQTALIVETWDTKGINTLIRDALALAQADAYTPSGYSVGYIPASLGDVSRYTAMFATVPEIIAGLAPNAYWSVDQYRRIHIFSTPDHISAATISLNNSSANIADLRYTVDGSDITNMCGTTTVGTTLAEQCGTGDTTIYVNDASAFTTAIHVFVGTSAYLLVSKDLSSTPHTLTLSAAYAGEYPGGALRTWPAGTAVVQHRQNADAAAIADLAANGIQQGHAMLFVKSQAGTSDEAALYIDGITDKFGYGVRTLSGVMVDSQHTGSGGLVPGSQIVATMTSPITISATFLVQRVTLTYAYLNGSARWVRSFEAATVERSRDVINILAKAAVEFPSAYL